MNKTRWLVLVAAALYVLAPGALAQPATGPTEEAEFKITLGVQGGLGLSGQLALGGRFFMLRELHGLGSGLGISFLVSARNVFVPTLGGEVTVGGPTIFTEILTRMDLAPFKIQAAVGMAIVKREGRSRRGIPVALATQGPYVGLDVRYGLDDHWALYAGGRLAFLDQATLTVTGRREIVSLGTLPALFVGTAWEF